MESDGGVSGGGGGGDVVTVVLVGRGRGGAQLLVVSLVVVAAGRVVGDEALTVCGVRSSSEGNGLSLREREIYQETRGDTSCV